MTDLCTTDSKISSEESDSDENIDDAKCNDEDTCCKSDIDKLFTTKHQILIEEKITAKNTYILHLCNNRSFNTIAAGLSDGTVKILDITTSDRYNLLLSEKSSFSKSKQSTSYNSVCGLKYLDDTSLLVGRTDGTITLYDLRTNKVEYVYQDNNNDNECKPICSFDINSNNRILCSGTEQINKDAFILFYDIRKQNLLGSYVDSHTDDITEIKFHLNNPDILMSGSTDGLINIFDISQTNEDDALIKTINTESSIYRLNWHKNTCNKSLISCITHTNDLFICDYDDSEILHELNRSIITESMKRKLTDDCNLINCHNLNEYEILLLATSNFNKGEILRTLKIQNHNLIPYSQFEDNKQIIRDSIFNEDRNLIITAGEGGLITLWNLNAQSTDIKPMLIDNKLKIMNKTKWKLHDKKPY